MRNDILIDRAVSNYYRRGGRRLVRAQFSSVMIHELEEGRQRLYVCLGDHTGLIAVYSVRKGGRLFSMRRPPTWIVANDRDPDWRAWCSDTEAARIRDERACGDYLTRLTEDRSSTPISSPTLIAAYRWSEEDYNDLGESLAELDRLPLAA
ncbi:hypothetical protein [Methylorubrum extorquens]|jgi:hypothetical protein|uniref:hypothetical protein n=1 Tax=Methylorubrum extorquens TaxID=408 RepID=UPI0012DB069B|nr:hypothetical protein [Methylorubrum extorquens]MCG5249637.1 hypothetical protein [Methylorubrum extorquens]